MTACYYFKHAVTLLQILQVYLILINPFTRFIVRIFIQFEKGFYKSGRFSCKISTNDIMRIFFIVISSEFFRAYCTIL